MTISLSINGHVDDNVLSRTRDYPERINKALTDAAVEATPLLERSIITHIIDKTHGGLYWDVNPRVFGTRGVVTVPHSSPHLILPRNAKVLHFTIDGREVFAQRVNHPGSNPPDVVEEAGFAATPAIERIYTEKLDSVFGGPPTGGSPAMPLGAL